MAEQPKTIHLKDYRRPDYRFETVELEFDLSEEATRVLSRLTVRRDAAGTPPLVLDADALTLVALTLDGRKLESGDYSLTDTALTIPDVPEAFILEVVTEINPQANTQLSGLYLSSGAFCTQCEAEGFRRITYYPDRPDVMAVYKTTIRADKARYPVLLSNGNLVDQGDLPDGRHFAVWHDPFPKPSYLFALVAGDLAHVEDRFTTASGREVTLRIYVEHGNEGRCDYAMDSLKRSMRWDEERFGLEYDLDIFNIVAVGDFNMGAMENKSLNVFNSKYILADPATATDLDYALIESVVAHEYFHNWTGNRITCRDWFQLSLKEGLTVYRDQEFSSDMRSRPVKRISSVRNLRARQFIEDAGPLKHPVRPDAYIEINNFYTATVYDKGAEVIGMMATILGRDGFRKGMDLYFQRHDGQAVTCDDFVACMEEANGADLSQFKLWYSTPGTPCLAVDGRYDAEARHYDLTVTQDFPVAMDIPLAMGLLDRQGLDLPLRLEGESGEPQLGRVLRVTEKSKTFRFLDVPEAPIPSLNREFSAPIKLKAPLTGEDFAFLMAHDSDPFNRWEAGQQYGTELMLGMVSALQRDEHLQAEPRFIDALGLTLDDDKLDKAFIAQALILPSEDYLAEQMAVIDVDAIHQVREIMRHAIADRLKDRLLAAYHGNKSNQPYSPDAAEAGQRALKNAALAYLSLDSHKLSLVIEQYRNADNMTDRMAALTALNDRDTPTRTEALEDFYLRFRHDPLVVDKWLAVQAMSDLPGTLDEVRKLMEHPAFSIRNPNKVRSLIGAFAANPRHFHAADGSGYRFLADQVIELNRINPQIAARMLTPLGRWARFDQRRQNLMRGELDRILASPGLSSDVFEIASKSLSAGEGAQG